MYSYSFLGLLDSPIVTAYMERLEAGQDSGPGGIFTFGGVDTINCDSIIDTVNLIDQQYYSFTVNLYNFLQSTSLSCKESALENRFID